MLDDFIVCARPSLRPDRACLSAIHLHPSFAMHLCHNMYVYFGYKVRLPWSGNPLLHRWPTWTIACTALSLTRRAPSVMQWGYSQKMLPIEPKTRPSPGDGSLCSSQRSSTMRGIVRPGGESLRSAVEHHLVHQRRSSAVEHHLVHQRRLLAHQKLSTGTTAVASCDHLGL